VRGTRAGALLLFAAALVAGTLTDVPRRVPPPAGAIVGDFHVHAAPGDGFLPVWEIQREAARRGIDAVAITNHNHALALRLGEWFGLIGPYPIVVPGQELTTPRFHMASLGIRRMVDWRLTARQAIAAIHAQGGAAIAAHPIDDSWLDTDVEALRVLDGAEIAHPVSIAKETWAREVRAFHARAREANPDVAAIGSSDFHGGPLGTCRTYLIVDELSQAGVLDAIRRGRTEARCDGPRGFGYGRSTWMALAALLALGTAVNAGPRPNG
jgi:hypothetical protein